MYIKCIIKVTQTKWYVSYKKLLKLSLRNLKKNY